MTRLHLTLAAGAALAVGGCGQPTHLQYDYGRAYQAAFNAQADTSRPSALHEAYPLSGEEGVALRTQVVKSSSDAETTKADAIK